MEKLKLHAPVFNSMTGTYMCPSCFKVYHVKHPIVTVDQETVEIDDIGIMDNTEFDTFINVKLTIESPCCSNIDNPQYLFPIDEKIADAVNKLNINNYFTESCCEGHIKDNTLKLWYIVFDYDSARWLKTKITDTRVMLASRELGDMNFKVHFEKLGNESPRKSNYSMQCTVEGMIDNMLYTGRYIESSNIEKLEEIKNNSLIFLNHLISLIDET